MVTEPRRLGDVIAATARRLAGRSVGIVLSGGGARALAHLGVREELSAAGVTFDRCAGVGLGSLVAAAAAAGCTVEGMRGACERAFVEAKRTNDFVPPAVSPSAAPGACLRSISASSGSSSCRCVSSASAAI